MGNKEKENDKERKTAEILEHICKVWNILTKEGFGVEDSHILLVLITMYKDVIFNAVKKDEKLRPSYKLQII